MRGVVKTLHDFCSSVEAAEIRLLLCLCSPIPSLETISGPKYSRQMKARRRACWLPQ